MSKQLWKILHRPLLVTNVNKNRIIGFLYSRTSVFRISTTFWELTFWCFGDFFSISKERFFRAFKGMENVRNVRRKTVAFVITHSDRTCLLAPTNKLPLQMFTFLPLPTKSSSENECTESLSEDSNIVKSPGSVLFIGRWAWARLLHHTAALYFVMELF